MTDGLTAAQVEEFKKYLKEEIAKKARQMEEAVPIVCLMKACSLDTLNEVWEKLAEMEGKE